MPKYQYSFTAAPISQRSTRTKQTLASIKCNEENRTPRTTIMATAPKNPGRRKVANISAHAVFLLFCVLCLLVCYHEKNALRTVTGAL